MSFEDILANQQQLLGAIEQIYTNFKKDGSDRKTSDYIRRRLDTLDAYWQDFQSNHMQLCNTEYAESHSYFTSKQYDIVKEKYEKFRGIIQQYQRPDDRPSTPLLKPATSLATSGPTQQSTSFSKTQGTNSKTDEMIRKQSSNFKAFEHTVSKINLNVVTEKWEFEHLLKTVQDRWSRIDTLHWELDSELGDRNQEYYNTYLKYENKYNDAIKAINKKMWSVSHREQATPKIEIPTFGGSYHQWTSFKDLFTESIHNNPGLSGAQKMQFLKTKVKGEAERLIQHLPITSDNYVISWDILKHRYDNKRMIFTSHINILLNLPISQQASINHIKRIHDSAQETLNAIKNLGVDVTSWDPLVVHLLCQKLDSDTFSEYNISIKQPRELPDLKEFLMFLESKFTSMEVSRRKQENVIQKPIPLNSKSIGNSHTNPSKSYNFKQTYSSNKHTRISQLRNDKRSDFSTYHCPICNDTHALYFCKQFLEMGPNKKKQIVSNLNLCINCLYDHNGKACLSKKRCRECSEFHNTLLHESYHQQNSIAKPSTSTQQDNARSTYDRMQKDNTYVAQQHMISEILLSTALLKVQKADGTYQTMRALIDQGSQTSLITENGAQLLGLPRHKSNNIISGIGHTENVCKGTMTLNCMSTVSPYSFNIDVYIMKNLTKYLPTYTFPKMTCLFLDNLELADPDYNVSRPIDILLGADVYSNIILGGMCRLSESLPIAQQTRLGWILCGGMKSLSCNVIQIDLDQIQQFWELEDVTEDRTLSSEDMSCIESYESSTIRLEDGRYQVRLPLKPDFRENLGKSKNKAIAQFLQLEKKLHNNSSIFSEYKSFINEYKQLGHMKPAVSNQTLECFLPHHCVLRKDSTTTKLRVVYNASSKTSTNKTLNDLMYSGPNLQQDLQSLILKWRQYRYAFTADIEKMFRQIWIHPDDQLLQKIVWRDDPHQKLNEYQLTTVTYGTKAAPFLAMMTLRQLAKDEGYKFPEAAKVIEESFYMDDAVHGSHSLSSAKKLQEDLINLLKLGGFNLRKWTSNDSQLLQQENQIYRDQEDLSFKQVGSTKTLGLRWDPTEDNFTYSPQINSQKSKVTKRSILSDMSKVFDPVGWIVPITTKQKILFQQTWLLKIQWDEQVPENINKEWTKLKTDLENINQFNIPRWYGTQSTSEVELHGFCDASTKSYACVIYCRVKNSEKSIILVAGKSKLVPTSKQISLPRLELCGAELLAKLMAKVKHCLAGYNISTFGWCDSTAVLGWLQGEPSRWKLFVANRTKQITEVMPPHCWRYVKSHENPADCASRGLTVSQLKDHSLWWYGPTWLKTFDAKRENNTKYSTEEDINSKKIDKQVHIIMKQESSIITNLLEKFNSINKISRILAWILRFIFIRKDRKHYQYLTLTEINKAKQKIIMQVQHDEFWKDICELKQHGKLNSKSKLLNLNPFLDKKGILRVGGRLRKANISLDMQHPIILPHNGRLTELLIQNAHQTMLHAGARLTLSFIRQKYWILGGNTATKMQIRRCVVCRKQSPYFQPQIMGDLPESRTNPSRPFTHTGIDFTGHIYVKASKGRGIRTTKGYVAVFVCMVTKAVHLELVSDLSTSAFLAALKRMTARRGTPREIYSDNGRNFVGANKILQQEYQDLLHIMQSKELSSEVLKMDIKWNFNAPSWPSAGGLWEAAVKSFKYHFKRVIGEQILTYEELYTVLTQIEACLNARPLCPISEDPDDLDYLTPAHFLTGGSNVNLHETETDLRTRWQLTQKIVQDLWKRWKHEYLLQITARSKWRQAKNNVQLNDVVMIQDDNLPPGKWLMGRIIELYPGTDGRVRVVMLKTKNGTLKRPVTKLSILPINENLQTQQKTSIVSNACIAKTNRINIASMFTYIMLFLTMITTCQGTLNITKFRNNQHVYFDKLSNMKIIRTDWKIIIYYNMEPYYEGITALNKSIQSIEKSCVMIPEHSPCDIILLQLRHGLDELEYNNHRLLSQPFDSRQNRWRRGLIDGVGYIAHGLFGVLDSRFAEQYEKDITLLRNNQKHIASFWQNQTSVIEAEFSLLKRTETAMQRQHKLIHQQLSKMENSLSALKSDIQNVSFTTNAIMGGIIASNLLHSLKDLQNALVDTITDIYHGRFNPHLITAQQLQDLASHLSNDVMLPIENIHSEFIQIYKLLRVKVRMLKNYSIFEVQIPLIGRDTYEIFKLIPIPLEKDDNTMLVVQPVSDFVAVNIKKDAYIILTENTLNSCLLTNIHLCHIHTPIYKLNNDKDFCQTTNQDECEVIMKPCRNMWLETYSTNFYIYFCCGQCRVRTICEDQITAYQLTHSGLGSIEQGCILKSDSYDIIAHEQRSRDVYITPNVYAPVVASINYLVNVSIPHHFWNESSSEIDQTELDALHDKIKILKENGALVDNLSYHDIHHYTLIYVVVTILAAVLAVYIWKRARARCAAAPAPAPGGVGSITGSDSVVQSVSERVKVASVRLADKATSPILNSVTSVSNL